MGLHGEGSRCGPYLAGGGRRYWKGLGLRSVFGGVKAASGAALPERVTWLPRRGRRLPGHAQEELQLYPLPRGAQGGRAEAPDPPSGRGPGQRHLGGSQGGDHVGP